ncbi:MAG: nucleoside 2-deoxyribosyltransferase domain-containing protein [bacterium]|nr:nucleoside 2-deoxyribosyltransferase domain-containing protein [bacterium]
MNIVFSGEDAPRSFSKSIFLAGPTPRNEKIKSWRPDALKIFKSLGYDGVVFVPEFRNGSCAKPPAEWTYEKQCNWEHKYLDMADIILFWVPRTLRTMPAFTTNVEFGLYANSGKIVLGTPKNWRKFPKNRYLNFMANKLSIPRYLTLEETISGALAVISNGALRRGGECSVPLNIWKTMPFQSWYKAQIAQGNKLENAKAISVFHKVGAEKKIVWGWSMRPNIYISREKRHKYNDPILARPDISSVVLIKRERDAMASKAILVREFRSAVSNSEAFVLEAPSGSSHDINESPIDVALQELAEETGFALDKSRLKILGSRQLAATFSIHKAHVYFAEITEDELNWFLKRAGKLKINDKDETGEKLYIEIKTIEQILKNDLLDWSNVGMILSAINNIK